jgi:5-methylcytosine-specific restriction endonuclease McrA
MVSMPRGVRAKEPSQPGHKVCVGCDTEKPFADFTKHSHSKDGLNPRCRTCTQALSRAGRAARPEGAKVYADPPLSKVCLGCHVDKPLEYYTLHKVGLYGRNSRCRECTRAENSAQRHADIEATREYGRNRYHNNPQVRETMRQYEERPEVRERKRVYARSYHWENREDLLEGIRVRSHLWTINNPDKVTATRHRRSAREIAAFVEVVTVADVGERDGWRCHICGKKVDRNLRFPHPMSATRDHLIPISRGGLHEMRNVKLAHWKCNAARGVDRLPAQLRLIG